MTRLSPFDQYRDGMNIFAYVTGDPISKVDPLGLDTGFLPIISPIAASYEICRRIERAGCRDKCVPGAKTFVIEKVWIVPNGRTPREIRTASIIDKVISWSSVPRFKLPYFDPTSAGCALSGSTSMIFKLHLGNYIATLPNMYLTIREYECAKQRCRWGLWITKRFAWKKGKKYDHECRVGDSDNWNDKIGAYENPEAAKASVKNCIDDFAEGFRYFGPIDGRLFFDWLTSGRRLCPSGP